MKKVQDELTETNPERVESFKAGARTAFKNILESFKDLQFFMGESCNPDGMHVLMNFREDGVTPYMLFWKDGLIEEKVVCVSKIHVHSFLNPSSFIHRVHVHDIVHTRVHVHVHVCTKYMYMYYTAQIQ